MVIWKGERLGIAHDYSNKQNQTWVIFRQGKEKRRVSKFPFSGKLVGSRKKRLNCHCGVGSVPISIGSQLTTPSNSHDSFPDEKIVDISQRLQSICASLRLFIDKVEQYKGKNHEKL